MFNKKNYKKVLISVLALMMIFGTVALAAEGIFDKKITATYGRVKFTYKGNDVTKIIENQYGTPAFTVDGRAYAPVRAMADLLGVDIDYDNNTHTVKITDSKEESYKLELEKKNKEIEELKKEVKKLEEAKKDSVKDDTINATDLKTLQTSLNRKYGEYEKIEFEVVLKENKNEISIDINTDLRSTKDEQNWLRMKYSDKKYLMEDVVSEVRKAFPNTDVTGSIYDSSSRKNLYTFRQTKNGSLSITNNDYGYDDRYDYGYGNLDSYVDSEFYREGIDNARIYSNNSGRWEESFEISFPDTDANRTAWNKIYNNRTIDYMLDRIAKDIEYYYNSNYDYIEIEVYRGSTRLGTYDTSRGFR
jgi:hypothetical protein